MVQELRIPQLKLELSKTTLRYKPGSTPECFNVTVTNQSIEFASFRLELVAAGALATDEKRWYRLTPSVSYKIPPGDRTQFQVEIVDVPPIRGGFVNSINLVVRVDALELDVQERQDLRLLVDGSPVRPLELMVRDAVIEARPGDPVELVVDVTNPNLKPADVILELDGIDPSWFPQEMQKMVSVAAESTQRVHCFGRVPPSIHAPQGSHFITVDGPRSPTPVTPTQVTLRIAPQGEVLVSHQPEYRQIPEKTGRWLNPRQADTTFDLTLDNQSNCILASTISLDDPDVQPSRRKARGGWFGRWRKQSPQLKKSPFNQIALKKVPGMSAQGSETLESSSDHTPQGEEPSVLSSPPTQSSRSTRTLTLTPPELRVHPGDTAHFTVHVSQRLPWLGWKRVKSLRATPQVDSSDIGLRSRPAQSDESEASPSPDTEPVPQAEPEPDGIQTLELHILPVIPFWLQGLGLLALLLLAIAPALLTPRGHTKPVNAVQFSGRANEVVSAANDGTIWRWVIRGNRLRPAGILERGDKALRVVRYRPVNNDQVAAGFENGIILMHDFLSRHTESFGYQQDDRVFDLAFTPDSRRLFSAHGSGTILEWQIDSQTMAGAPIQSIKVDFAIQAIGLVGDGDQYVAIAGRYNQLTLYDRDAKTFYDLPYLPGSGQNDYITSLATAGAHPTRFATSDNQGRIALWDLAPCEDAPQTCQPIDDWPGHGGNAVHQVALSADACYLASVGADGQAIVWPLDSQGGRQVQHLEGQAVQAVQQPLNAVALIQQRDQLLVASGGDDTWVRLNTMRLRRARFPGEPCQGL